MGSMVGAMQPSLREFGNQMNQQAFNQQLGRGVSNQMYQPPRSDYDPYTASRRPNYMPYGPNQQFYQPIYQPSYSQFSPMGYGQAPFGGFYQPPMMGFGQRFGNQMFQQPQRQNMFGPATDISAQGQAALRQMPQQFYQPMMPPPLQQQYRPVPYMTQSQLDARTAAAVAPPSYDYGGGGDGGFGGGGGGVSDGGGYSGPGSVGAEGATDSGGMGPGDGAGDGGAGASGAASGDSGGVSSGEGLEKGGYIRRPSYGGIDSLLRK